MKAAFAAVLTGLQNLDHDETCERPVDRLGALGAIQRRIGEAAADDAMLTSLGVELVSFKFAHRVDARPIAEQLLADILGWRRHCKDLKAQLRLRISRWAIQEWAIDFCPTCRGSKETPSTQEVEGARPMLICSTCAGSGRRRYTDEERAEALGEAAGGAMYHAHGIIGQAEALAVRRGAQMLERWGR